MTLFDGLDIRIANGLPVCQRPDELGQPYSCSDCYGLGRDADGTPLCMEAVRRMVEALGFADAEVR
jgi:hypothetical protein